MFKRLLLALPVLLAPALASAEGPGGPGGLGGLPKSTVQYSATRTMETEMMDMSSKVFVTPDKERTEMEMMGSKHISIMRRDKNVTWTLMPMQHTYMEHAIGGSSDKQHENPDDYKYELTKVGEEQMNGFNCEKSKLIITKPDGTKMGGFIWVAQKEHIPVKMDALAKIEGKTLRFKMELSDIKIGPQPAELFEIPEGYTKMTGMPGMGGMPGGQQYGSKYPPATTPSEPPAAGASPSAPGGMPSGGAPAGMDRLPPNSQGMIRQRMKNAGQGQ